MGSAPKDLVDPGEQAGPPTTAGTDSIELSVLGGFLADPPPGVVEVQLARLAEWMFTHDRCRQVFQSIVRTFGEHRTADAISVLRDLRGREEEALERFVFDLMDMVATPHLLEPHVEQLVHAAIRTKAARELRIDPEPPLDSELERAMQTIQDLRRHLSRRPPLELLTDAQVEALPTPSFLVGDAIVEQGLSMLFGPPASWKTFLALDVAQSLQTGVTSVLGPVPRARPCVYVLAEASGGFGRRLAAWREAHKVSKATGLLILRRALLINDPREQALLVSALNDLESPPALVVLDTVARTNSGDENLAADVRRYVDGCDKLRAEVGCAVLLLHHPGWKTDRERGSTSWRASVDTLMRIDVEGDGRGTLTCEKQRDAEGFHDIALDLTPTGSSAVIRVCDPSSPPSGDPPAAVRRTLRLLSQHSDEDGLSATAWRNVVHEQAGFSESTFYRHAKALYRGGFVTKEKIGRSRIYRVSAEGERWLS